MTQPGLSLYQLIREYRLMPNRIITGLLGNPVPSDYPLRWGLSQ
nr:MAG TPA: hypothetical protein [Caudoviricetes sp.]